MQWPWRRFEEFFHRHLLRRARDQLERQRDLMIAAVNANTNYDGEDAQEAKLSRLREIEQSTNDAITVLYRGLDKAPVEEEDQYSYENDPLFRPVRRAMMERAQSLGQEAGPPQMAEAGRGADLLDSMV